MMSWKKPEKRRNMHSRKEKRQHPLSFTLFLTLETCSLQERDEAFRLRDEVIKSTRREWAPRWAPRGAPRDEVIKSTRRDEVINSTRRESSWISDCTLSNSLLMRVEDAKLEAEAVAKDRAEFEVAMEAFQEAKRAWCEESLDEVGCSLNGGCDERVMEAILHRDEIL